MKRIHRMTLAAATLCLAVTSAHALEGDAKAGEQAAAMCVACHQANGGGMNIPGGESWPSIAGLNADYLYKQLKDGRSLILSATPNQFGKVLQHDIPRT